MSEKEEPNTEESVVQDAMEKNGQEQDNDEEACSSKDDQKNTKNEMDFKMTKPW